MKTKYTFAYKRRIIGKNRSENFNFGKIRRNQMDYDKFRVDKGTKLKLKDFKTDDTGDYKEKEEAEEDLEKNIKRLTELQDILYAQNVYALLIIFQAMDAAGKD